MRLLRGLSGVVRWLLWSLGSEDLIGGFSFVGGI